MSENNQLSAMRHSCEHVLMQAMQRLYPNKFLMAMGPATDDGFYFDFEPLGDFKISDENFPEIETEMAKIIKENLPIDREEINKEEAKKLFAANPYKLEWLENIDKPIIYKTGKDFVDLCSGPHIESTGKIGAFKLLSIAGAYWHGDEKNKMLTRIYGTAFETQKELDEYLHNLEEAKKRDHRKLGKELGLFTFSDLVGSGFPLYTPKGAFLRLSLNNYVEEVQSKQKYTQVWTPQIAKAKLFQISGHYEKYKDGMFKVVSNHGEEEFFLKPMNCPQHTQIYAASPKSYRDLPVRYTDFAMLYRDEQPGELSGLARVRSFSQDDCHIFCREDQVDQEVDTALAMIKEIMTTFGLKYKYRLSTRDPKTPEKYLGDPKIWDKAEKWAVEIMKRNKIEYFDGPGEAAFYAPKMDLIATDALGREWQLSTLQIDYVMPERFGLEYTDSDGTKKRPIMLHRAIIGSPERFIMILTEQFAGAFPLWLAPVQVSIIPITDKQQDYALKLGKILEENGIRYEIDDKAETMQNKIRNATAQKIPYMLIAGGREAESSDMQISVRQRDGVDLKTMPLQDFIKAISTQISTKSLNLIK
jgi:threonyl-tRNA synthetase